ncbi:MAG: addiction module protein [Bacteroidetes bacterium]|nr:addiction module protein [Bacteroidota bacterium]MBU2585353.1 addiction module protein [Bacteroidota bacterium]
MDSRSILKEALHLRPAERLQLIELLTQSLSKPDEKIEQIWAEESERRYKALKEEKVKTIPLNDIIQRYK